MVAAVAVAAAACTSSPTATPSPDVAATDSPAPSAAAEPPSPRPTCDGTCRGRPRVAGSFAVDLAPEASGLAASRRNPGLLYIVDDGPSTTSLLVINSRGSQGTRRAQRLPVADLEGVDTEDLAVGPCRSGGDRTCIYIADIGDNLTAREHVTITRLPEPDLSAGMPDQPLDAEQIALTYPDGPHDAEALLVADDGALVIITKAAGRRGRGAARLYTAEKFATGTLGPAGRLRLPYPSVPLATAVVGNVVTGADAAPGRVAVRTYDAVFEFTAPGTRAHPSTLNRWRVQEISAPSEPQGEAIAYATDGCGLYTVSEDSPRLYSIPCH